jgi:hypothetical protein
MLEGITRSINLKLRPTRIKGYKPMENNEMKQSFEAQQVGHLKVVNDKLLHKYVAEVTDARWRETLWLAPLYVIVFIPLGILANLKIGLNWPVIITFWACCFCTFLCDIINTYPLSKGSIIITPAHALRETLLKYGWRDRVSTAIYLPIVLGIFIWLAFELRHTLNYHVLGLEIQDKISDFVFWVTLFTGFIIVLGSIIQTYYSTSRLINRLVADIDDLNCNNK